MFTRCSPFVVVGLCVAASVVSVPQAAGPQEHPATPPARPASSVRASLDQYCVTCHNARLKTAGLTLDKMDLADVPAGAEVWEKVVRKLRSGAMPPPGARRPDQATADALVTWLETTLDAAGAAAPNPGRPVVHRLNRVEYANAVRDLLALDIDTATLLPPDDSSQGFDNIADVLGVSPALLEGYLAAAARISSLAVGDPSIGASSETFHVRGDASQTAHVEGLPLGTRGGLLAHPTLPLDGEYVIKVKLLQTNLGGVRRPGVSRSARDHRSTASACILRRWAGRPTIGVAGQCDRCGGRARRAAAGTRVRQSGSPGDWGRRSCKNRPRKAATASSRSCAAR